jgi:hypothetical protein
MKDVWFDWPVLMKPTASFESLRTSGWFIEGLATNGGERAYAIRPYEDRDGIPRGRG